MKVIAVSFFFFFCSFVYADFPYYVSEDILNEVKVNQLRYELAPTQNEVMFDLAMSYAYSGQIVKGWSILKKIPKEYSTEVITIYTQLMQQDPTQWKYPFKCAFGYFFVGEKQQAIDLFFNVLDLEPNQVWAYGFIALVYGEMGDVEQTIKYCKQGLAIEPNATAIHFLLGEAYRKQGHYFKALKQLFLVGRLEQNLGI